MKILLNILKILTGGLLSLFKPTPKKGLGTSHLNDQSVSNKNISHLAGELKSDQVVSELDVNSGSNKNISQEKSLGGAPSVEPVNSPEPQQSREKFDAEGNRYKEYTNGVSSVWLKQVETSVPQSNLLDEYGYKPGEFIHATSTVSLKQVNSNPNLRCIEFIFSNPRQVGLTPFMYASLMLLVKNSSYLEFGHHKTLLSTGHIWTLDGVHAFSLHSNVFVNNNDSPIDILRLMTLLGLKSSYNPANQYYGVDQLREIHIRVWNMDNYANKNIRVNKTSNKIVDLATGSEINRVPMILSRKMHTANNLSNPQSVSSNKAFKNVIGHLQPVKNIKTFGTGDVETVHINGKQIPICISACYDGKTYFFIVDKELMVTNQKEAVQNMFNEYFDFVIKQGGKTTFYHNLGSFDGRYICEALIKYASNAGRTDKLSFLIDDGKKFINIKYIYDDSCAGVVFQDSLRLFGVSLKKLCGVYNVDGKISDYNMDFNKLDVLDNVELLATLKEYSLQDSKCLYDALLKAQSIYFEKYNVDIVNALSTASLSKRIFRTHFMKNPIPVLNGMTDGFVRKGYFGGATDVYHKHGKDLYYYDVNSLYPHVMKKKMPTKVIKRHVNCENIDIYNFFGYIECVVKAPEGIKNPIIPKKSKGRTLYPMGEWKGVYFSEMIKEAIKYGYEFKFLTAIEFEGEFIFEQYIDHFYKIKADAKAKGDVALTFMAKMHLNQLYGVFGMKQSGLTTKIIDNKDLDTIFLTERVVSIKEIDANTSLILIENSESNVSRPPANFMCVEGGSNTASSYSIKSNVAIAAAVTAYGQIEMMKFKNNPDYNIYYTDTDSIFIDKPLPENLVGNSLGQLKNETQDKYGVETINEAYFLGVKKYGYRVVKDNVNYDSSVFAGVKRDSLSFETVEKISNGVNYTVKLPSRLYKSSNSLSIVQKDNLITTITKDFHKTLLNNFYHPMKIVKR